MTLTLGTLTYIWQFYRLWYQLKYKLFNLVPKKKLLENGAQESQKHKGPCNTFLHALRLPAFLRHHTPCLEEHKGPSLLLRSLTLNEEKETHKKVIKAILSTKYYQSIEEEEIFFMGDKKGFVAKTAFELPSGRRCPTGRRRPGYHLRGTKGNMS